MSSSVPALGTLVEGGSPLQAVLLDMDGTLVDTEGCWWDAECEVFAELGHPLREEWRQFVVGGPMARSAGFLIEATRADIGLEQVSRLLNARFVERLTRLGPSVPLMPGAGRLLEELAAHGLPAALVSASHRHVVDRMLLSLGATNFACTVAGDELERTKPHPDPYLTAAERLGVDPSRCAVLEDTETGVVAAEAAGCRVVAVPSVAPIEARGLRTVVRSLEEVDLAFLRSLITVAH